jgi:antitoxin CcdA
MELMTRIASQATARGGRRATNVSLSSALVDEARRLGVNVSQASEEGVAAAVRSARRSAWLAENGAALESSNEHADRNGLPLADLRRF